MDLAHDMLGSLCRELSNLGAHLLLKHEQDHNCWVIVLIDIAMISKSIQHLRASMSDPLYSFAWRH